MFPEITRDDVFRLETRRLWLRWPVLADAEALTGFAGQSDVAEMTAHIPHPYPKGEAAKRIDRWRQKNASGRGLKLVMTPREGDRVPFGVIGLDPSPAGFALGGIVASDKAGQGFATEAAQAILDAAFILSDVRQVEAAVRVTNPMARRVIEKCGFSYEGTALQQAPARGGMVSVDCFRLDRKAWASLKQWRMPHLTPRRTEPLEAGRSTPP